MYTKYISIFSVCIHTYICTNESHPLFTGARKILPIFLMCFSKYEPHTMNLLFLWCFSPTQMEIVFMTLFCRLSEKLVLKTSLSFLNACFPHQLAKWMLLSENFFNFFQWSSGKRQKNCYLLIWIGADIYTCISGGGSDLAFILLKIKDHFFALKFKKSELVGLLSL